MFLIFHVSKPVLSGIINQIFKDLVSLTYIQTIHECFPYRMYDCTIVSNITNFAFCRKKVQILSKNIRK